MSRASSFASALLLVAAALTTAAAQPFVTFESGQVRPLALSADGTRLFAVDTPDNTLEIFAVAAGGLTHEASVPVGLEPVTVAPRSATEVWVVNHLSDSISIVDLATSPPRVVRTLLTCDEPRDLVFAGPGKARAFVTTARRGQNCSVPANLTTPGEERALVQVFDATNLGATLGGTPLTTVELFGDTPRALAVTPDGSTVYAAVFQSGNQTTTVSEGAVCNGGSGAAPCDVMGVTMPGGLPAPNMNHAGTPGPETGLIVRFDPMASEWRDGLARNWNNAVNFSLPDLDVFAIDATANPPAQTTSFAHVGTVLFDMAVNPVSGKVYVSNTEARNEVRFEGPGTFFGSSTVRGHLHEARVTVLDGASVLPRHLNKHIDYGVVPSPPDVKARSLAIPTALAVTQDGTRVYVAAFGSSKVGVFDTAALEQDTFVPDAASHIGVSGGGPSGLVLDEAHGRLYVLTRFDNALKAIDTTTHAETETHALHSAEPAIVKDGRPVLYDAQLTSSNGEASCATCHVFGDFDSLGWDLGNPDDDVLNDPNPRRVPDPLGTAFPDFHPLKGPMTTQSLRGMANHGPMHWRGDRTGGNDPFGSSFDEAAGFKKFIVAFAGLLGHDGPISDADMQRFTDFILEVTYPPNPNRALDNSLTADQQAGRDFFFASQPSDVFQNCNGCHRLDPSQGFFGSDGFSSFEFEPQFMKIPHLRNLYQKVGMFGMVAVPFVNLGDNGFMGDQVRGFGYLHDGSVDTAFRFLHATVFNQTNPGGLPVPNPGGFPNGVPGETLRRQVQAFLLAFDSNLAPIVGQQTTLDAGGDAMVGTRIDLLLARAAANECDVVVKGTLAGEQRGWVRGADGSFQSDRAAETPLDAAVLRAQAATAGQERTFTCVPPGSGQRIGVDRDGDGYFDRDELDAGTDPADPDSHPTGGGPTEPEFVLVPTQELSLRDDVKPPVDPTRRRALFTANTRRAAAANRVTPPARGGDADPTLHGGVLVLYNAANITDDAATVMLPASGWQTLGKASRPRGFRFRGQGLTVIVRADRIGARARGTGLTYTLDEPQQGAVGVRLLLGDGAAWCAAAPARAASRHDRPGRFHATSRSPAPDTCPAVPTVGSPSGAFFGGGR